MRGRRLRYNVRVGLAAIACLKSANFYPYAYLSYFSKVTADAKHKDMSTQHQQELAAVQKQLSDAVVRSRAGVRDSLSSHFGFGFAQMSLGEAWVQVPKSPVC